MTDFVEISWLKIFSPYFMFWSKNDSRNGSGEFFLTPCLFSFKVNTHNLIGQGVGFSWGYFLFFISFCKKIN